MLTSGPNHIGLVHILWLGRKATILRMKPQYINSSNYICGFLPAPCLSEDALLTNCPLFIHFKETINQLLPMHLAFSAHPVEILMLEKELGVVFFPRQEHGWQSLKGVWTEQWPLRHLRTHHSLILSWDSAPSRSTAACTQTWSPMLRTSTELPLQTHQTQGTQGERHTAGV